MRSGVVVLFAVASLLSCGKIARGGPSRMIDYSRSFGFGRVFGNGMVLRARERVSVYGHCPFDDTVTVILKRSDGSSQGNAGDVVQRRSVRSTVPGKFWKIFLEKQDWGGRFDLVAVSATLDVNVSIANVTFGSVWLCATNSVMERDVSRDVERGTESTSDTNVREKDDTRVVRLLRSNPQPFPLITSFAEQPAPAWQRPSDKNLSAYGALIEMCHREARRHHPRSAPIGFILAVDSGSFLEAWIPAVGQLNCAGSVCPGIKPRVLTSENAESCAKRPPWEGRDSDRSDPTRWISGNGQLFNGLVAPIASTTLTGIVWGSTMREAKRRNQCLLSLMSKTWNDAWARGCEDHCHPVIRAGFLDRSVPAEDIERTPAQSSPTSRDSLEKRLLRIRNRLSHGGLPVF